MLHVIEAGVLASTQILFSASFFWLSVTDGKLAAFLIAYAARIIDAYDTPFRGFTRSYSHIRQDAASCCHVPGFLA